MLWFKLAETRLCFQICISLGLYENVPLPNEVLLSNNIEDYKDYKVLFCKVYFCKMSENELQ